MTDQELITYRLEIDAIISEWSTVQGSMIENRTSKALERAAIVTATVKEGFWKGWMPSENEWRILIENFPAIAEKYKRMEEALQDSLTKVPMGSGVYNVIKKALAFDPISPPSP